MQRSFLPHLAGVASAYPALIIQKSLDIKLCKTEGIANQIFFIMRRENSATQSNEESL